MGFFEEIEQEQQNNSLWVERYRPSVLENFIGNEHLKNKVADFIETKDVPHLLLYGKAGGGKTTLAKIIVKNIDCDYLLINASDENNVETVRTKIKNFASSRGFNPLKIMILDEADFLTYQSQPILRNLMETFSGHCRFIITCNYIEKIIDPIQSRCQTFEIVPPTKKEVAIHVAKILEKEEITFDPKNLVPIIDSAYPDVRKIINTCQMNSRKGELKIDTKRILENDYKIKVLDILKSNDQKRNKYMNIRKVLADSRVKDFTDLYELLYEKVDEYAPNNTSAAILVLAEGQYKASMCIDKEIPTMSMLIELLNVTG